MCSNVSQPLDSNFKIKWVIDYFVEEDWKVVKWYMKKKKDFDMRDFGLLIVQIKVIEEDLVSHNYGWK